MVFFFWKNSQLFLQNIYIIDNFKFLVSSVMFLYFRINFPLKFLDGIVNEDVLEDF